jgi:signal transduction histidine kinase/CheY-like chemotaxis protein
MPFQRTSPTMWFKVYVALAAASLCIACVSIWLGSTLITAHRESVRLHAEWGARQNSLGALSLHAAVAHRAVAGEFGQGSEAALETLRGAGEAFDEEVLDCFADLHLVHDRVLALRLVRGVKKAQEEMRTMVRQGGLLFEAMEATDLGEAGRHLAHFNMAYGEVNSALAPLRPAIRGSIERAFAKQLADSERLERVQYTVALFVCGGVIAAFWYGRRLYESTSAAEREHEQYLLALAERRDAAEAASRAKSEFLANMSHEIRTPMAAMLGYADLLADPEQSNKEREQCIRTIRRSGEHLLSILNEILDLSKIEAGQMSVEVADCSPVQLVEEVYSLMQPRALELGITLRTVHEFPLPRTVSVDPLRLKQILLNLVGNAIKFTPGGEVMLLMSLKDGELSLAVRDTGVGMSPEQVERIFQPFTQVDGSTTRRFGGTGLGLSISRRLAEMMGARIDVESREGEGSTFTLRLPIGGVDPRRLASDVEEAVVTHCPITPGPVRLSGRVLLAEDGPDNQRLIMTFLRRAGADVVLAETGREAVRLALEAWRAEAPFQLVLMDMQMPELDGYAAARLLRARGYDGPILALTAHAMPGERERCLAAGCEDFLSKPIVRQKFLEMCRGWMDRGRAAAA